MKKNFKVFTNLKALFFIPLFLCISGTAYSEALWSMNVGDWYEYNNRDSATPANEWTFRMDVVGTVTYGEQEYFDVVFHNINPLSGIPDVHFPFRSTDNAVYRFKGEEQLVWQIAPIGTEWSYADHQGTSGQVTTKIIGIEQVTVSFGTFDNAYVHESYFYPDDPTWEPSHLPFYEYIVPGIGLVKSIDPAELNPPIVSELVGRPFHLYDDPDQDLSIGDFELLDAIDDWAQGNLGDFELLDLIDLWAAGCYHWDASAHEYEPGCKYSYPIVLLEWVDTQPHYSLNLYYIYSDGTGFKNIKNNLTRGSWGSIEDDNNILFSEEINADNYSIYIYHIDTGTISTVVTGASRKMTMFSPDNRVLFIRNGIIKKANLDGSNEQNFILPDSGWQFVAFFYSPDKTRLLTRSSGSGLDKTDMYNADGTYASAIYGPHNSDIFNYFWNLDGTEIIYTYEDQNDSTEHVLIIPIDGSPIRDLSSEMPRAFYVWGRYNNLFSLDDRNFYSPSDGSFVCTMDVPAGATPALLGFGKYGYVYFADSNGSNLFKVLDCN